MISKSDPPGRATLALPAPLDTIHYPSSEERLADLLVHVLGLLFAVAGGGAAVILAMSHDIVGLSAAIAIYALGLTAMLAFSAAYNFAHPRFQPFLFRLDHAGIFLMIAASYTLLPRNCSKEPGAGA